MGREGQDAARESLWIDFGFLIAYGTLLTLALAATRDLARRRAWRRLAALGAGLSLRIRLAMSADSSR